MTHFTVAVVLGTDIDPSDRDLVEARLKELMHPYDEDNRKVVTERMDREDLASFKHFYSDAEYQARIMERQTNRVRVIPADSPTADFLPFIKDWNSGMSPRVITDTDDEGEFETFEWFETRNPDGEWDWYAIGGRWLGYVNVKPGAPSLLGDPGTMGNDPVGGADVFRKGDIDYETMSLSHALDAARAWDEVFDKYPDDEGIREILLDAKKDETREQYIARVASRDLASFAFLNGDGWHARSVYHPKLRDETYGGRGKFVNDEEWETKTFPAFWDSLSDDTVVAFVDCHR